MDCQGAYEAQIDNRISSLGYEIVHLMDQRPLQEKLIENKLNELDQLIAQIPCNFKRLSISWKKKSRSFRKKFAQILLPPDLRDIFMRSMSSSSQLPRTSSKSSSSSHQNKPPLAGSKQTKEIVQAQLHKWFDHAEKISGDDKKQVESLLLALTCAIKLLSVRYVSNNYPELRETALDLALDKLSNQQRFIYLHSHGLLSRQPRTLDTLHRFLESRLE